MKSCKKCKNYDSKNSSCIKFNIFISSTLNATRCKGYDVDLDKERKMKNSSKRKLQRKDYYKKKRSKICINCESNKEGYCSKHKAWCNKVNYICLGVRNPEEYKIPKNKKQIKNCIKKNPINQ